jgi:cysteinyl-tRNA synthetase
MLKIFNTLPRKLEEFKPLHDNKVTFYHCGPTVYWVQHIGNLRGMTMADLARRSLEYMGYDVDFVRNYTDVGHLTSDEDAGEDKMEKGAKREGLTPQEIADKYIKLFEADTSALNIISPDFRPRATEYVEKMIEITQTLLDKGFAYITPKAIYFDVTKFPEYNKLNRQKMEMNRKGAGFGSVEDPDKKNPEDFSLWFFRTGTHKNALQYWKSPFSSSEVENGNGFPGWHIECSAMAISLLGETIDIHMGGIEHIAVHHTNEIAQSECYTGKSFVKYWMHNEHLLIDDEKMSKSVGNVYNLSDIIDKGYDPIDLRYFFLQSHYRSKQNFTWEALTAAKTASDKIINILAGFAKEVDMNDLKSKDNKYIQAFQKALSEDFNIPAALAVLWDTTKATDLSASEKFASILSYDSVLGLNLKQRVDFKLNSKQEFSSEVEALLKLRLEARNNKNWKESDRIRDLLSSQHSVKVKDTAEGQIIEN